jgi:hypothetical protein
MSKKLAIGFSPVLVIAAFALMPAAAQAEPHFYSNHIGLPAESGGPGAEGKDFIAWGNLEYESLNPGKLRCGQELGGDVYNPGGPGGAQPGEGKIDAYTVYDCTNEVCEGGDKSKLEVIPGGLEKFGEWEMKLFEPELGIIRLKIGNKIRESPTQWQWLLVCPPAGSGEFKLSERGELTPKLKNGTAVGSAPSKIEFGTGSGELELGGSVPEGRINGGLKVMGFETGEIVTTSNP